MSTEKNSSQSAVTVTSADLPLCCPLPDQPLWNQHPRVYLPIERTGEVDCPYCGAHYKMSKK